MVPFDKYLERFCLGFPCMDSHLRSLSATTRIPSDIAVSIQALSPQRQNRTETGGIVLNYPVDGRHRDGNQSRLCLDGEFLGSVALFTID
jgi:hypothetical protein